jgi:hypothetical protein
VYFCSALLCHVQNHFVCIVTNILAWLYSFIANMYMQQKDFVNASQILDAKELLYIDLAF